MKLLKFISALSFVLITHNLMSQIPSWQWAVNAGGKKQDIGYSACTDMSGNIYVCGNFGDSAYFDTINIKTGCPIGCTDFFIAKYSNDGEIIWVKNASGLSWSDDCIAYSISTSPSGTSYITGTFEKTLAFDTDTLYAVNNGKDIFIAKYDSDGNELWAKAAGSTFTTELPASITTDNEENIYITGIFTGNLSFDTINVTGSMDDIFVAKYDSGGNILWAKSADGTADPAKGTGISLDDNGNVYVSGYFWNSASFDSITLYSSGGTYDAFIAKYDSDGEIIWANKAGGTSTDKGIDIVAETGGNTYLYGFISSGSATFDTIVTPSNGAQIFIAKYNPDGHIIWVETIPNMTTPTNIERNQSNSVFITGQYIGQPSIGIYQLQNTTSNDVFIAKYDSDGNVQWAKDAGGDGNDNGYGIAVDASGTIYVTGEYGDTASFDSHQINSIGFGDIFLAQIEDIQTGQNLVNKKALTFVSPNPFSNYTVIKFNTGISTNNINLQLYDVYGKEIKCPVKKEPNHIIIEKGNISPGIYFFRVYNNYQIISTGKLVVK